MHAGSKRRPMGYEISALKIDAGRRFEEFYAIYESSLPSREQKSRPAIRALIHRDDYRVLLLESEATVLAFSVVFISKAYDFCLLEYMATRADQRNRGLGGAMLEASLAAAPGRPMLVEVNSEREDSPDREIRIRRKGFYRRHGCLQIAGLDYLLPLSGRTPPPEMDLLVHRHGRVAPIRKTELAGWLTEIYTQAYARTADDPRIRTMLQAFGDMVNLT